MKVRPSHAPEDSPAVRLPPIRTYDLARSVAPVADALTELHRRFMAQETRLTEAFGEDEEPTFDVFLEWVVSHVDRPPGRPRGSRDRSPASSQRRRQGQLRRRGSDAEQQVAAAA